MTASPSERSFQRAAGVTALVGVGFGLLSGALLLVPTAEVAGQIGILALIEDQGRILDSGAASFLRWGYLADMLGFYLLWLPLIVAVHPRVSAALGPQAARLASICGVLYVALGSLGAALLGTLLPGLMETADVTSYLVAETLVEAVHRGVWQTLDAITGGVWLILCGEAFRRSGHPVLGWGGIASGCVSLLLALGWLLQVPLLVLIGLGFLAPVVLWIAGVARELLQEAA